MLNNCKAVFLIFSNKNDKFKKVIRGAWMTQSVKSLNLDLSSGHDLRVLNSNPVLGSMLGMKPTKKKKKKKIIIYLLQVQ